MSKYRLPAEWEPQSGVQLTLPHKDTDWADILPEVTKVYDDMAKEISKREKLLTISNDEIPTNDTWARDHGFITTTDDKGHFRLNDFTFNGWGMKFPANLDNQINTHIYNKGILNGEYICCLDFTLEGGSIESDGQGTILTTSECLLSKNRNEWMTRQQIEQELKYRLNAERILWLDHGYLAGDDTDSHIDTLARICPNNTITYVQCTDKEDEHYIELKAMEEQLRTFRTIEGSPYNLIPLPFPTAIYDNNGCRLPATYANFLIINGAVLMPTYGQPENDAIAAKQLQSIFCDRDIVGIDCQPLIQQHGSLHCCTMQFPEGVIK